MQTELGEQIKKLNRITLLESFISNTETIDAINEAIDNPPATSYSSAEELTKAILGEEEEQ